MIFVNNLKSVFNQEWKSADKYPGLRWKLLIDKDFNGSTGLSLGYAEMGTRG